MFPTSTTRDKGKRCRWMKQRVRGGCKGENCRRIKLPNILVTRLQNVAAFWYQKIEGHAKIAGIEWNEDKCRNQTL